MEKKLLVKEKAFEYERAEYHDQILNLNTRVNALVKIIETTKHSNQNKPSYYHH
jgi:hypothetical protein